MKISIITVCYNSEKTIEDTIKSVLKQTYDNYEYLIIDGCSKDNTLKIVKKYEKDFKGKLRIFSEKDKGLYDAMNKGIKLATGDIIGIINSDDVLANKNVFKHIVKNYNKATDVLYGDLIYCDANLNIAIRDYISGKKKSKAWCPAHPTMYIRKEVFERVGYYNLDYKVAADYDMMVRLNKANCRFQYLKEYMVLMRLGGVSNGFKGYLNSFKDAYNILKHNQVSFAFIRTFNRTIRIIFQYIKTKFKRNNLHKYLDLYYK